MRILAFTPYYLPGFRAGGPIRSVANLVDHLGQEHEFRVLTSDRDLGDRLPYQIAGGCEWTSVGRAVVAYLPPDARHAARVRELVAETNPDLLYLNGLFNVRFSLLALGLRRLGLLGRAPILLAPRGELGPGALALKGRKKWAVLEAARRSGTLRGVAWQATCDAEADDIRARIGPSTRVHVAPNIASPGLAAAPARPPKRVGSTRLAYVSRITPKKNLLGGLRLLAEWGLPASLDIWGPVDDAAYWRRCGRQIDRMPAQVAVSWRGELNPHRVAETLGKYDGLFLPTLNENFGHVMAEALGAGCPLLISDRTPWRGLREAGVGWDLPLDQPEAFMRALSELSGMGEEVHAAMRDRARRFAARCAEGAAFQMSQALRLAG